MLEVRTENFGGNDLRVLGSGKDAMISVTDLARTMGFSNNRISRMAYPCEDVLIPTGGGRQTIKVISVKYALPLLFKSRMPEATGLGEWVLYNILGVEI